MFLIVDTIRQNFLCIGHMMLANFNDLFEEEKHRLDINEIEIRNIAIAFRLAFINFLFSV